jgi:hypothetical protein
MSLSDSFPQKFKSDYSERNFMIGKVLRLKVKDTNPPKIKRFVIVGFSEDKCTLASVYINSEINRNINWSLEQQELQVELTPESRSYLTKTSYIDCSQLIIRECEKIVRVVESRPDSIIGELDESDLNVVITKLKEARTIKGKIKKKYGLFDL